MKTLTKIKRGPRTPAAAGGPSAGYVSTIAAARLCGVSVFSIQRWFDEGLLTGAKLPGGRRRIDAKRLDLFIKKHVVLASGNPNLDQRRVLVVEDDAKLLSVMNEGLTTSGFLVRTATSGLEAGLALADFKPDCVVLDVMLEDLPSATIVRQLRRSQAGRAARIVAISGRAGSDDVREILGAGANAFLKKPFTQAELMKAITSRQSARR